MEARFFSRMNSSLFLGSEIGEDSKNFIDEVKKIFGLNDMITNDKMELLYYRLKDITYIEFTQWKENRGIDIASILVIA